MATKRKAEDYASGISVQDGHAQIDENISELPDQSFMKCYKLKEVNLPLSIRIIGDYCFAKCTFLKTATIPNSVEVIGKAAFFHCTNLTNVSIAQDQPRLRVIGEQAFAVCRALKGIETPESVVQIGPKAFHACWDLLNVKILGRNVRTIQEEVFSGCSSLKEAILPSSLTSIEKMAFQGCRNIHTIRQQGQQETPGANYGVFLSSNVRVNESAYKGCPSLARVVEKKENIEEKKKAPPPRINVQNGHAQIRVGISELPSQALMCRYTLKEVSIPNSVRVIGDSCFAQCSSLKKANIPNSVEVIGRSAFFYCTNLTDLTIAQDQARLRVIGRQAFGVCRTLKHIEMPESVVEIGRQAFHASMDLLNVTIHGSNVTVIQQETFSGCSSLEEVILPSSVTSIERMAFQGCRKLHTVWSPQGQREQTGAKGLFLPSIVSVGLRSFESCKSLESVVLSESIRIIDYATFRGCENLKEFQFPEGLEVIEGEAMSRCSSLGFARLPPSLVRIGREAFADCSTLHSVIIPPRELSRLRSVEQMAFRRCVNLYNICFPEGADIHSDTHSSAVWGCDRLQNLFPHHFSRRFDNFFDFGSSMNPGVPLVGPLTTRFDRLPLLGLCYHQSYYSSGELIGRFNNKTMAGGASKTDLCGMTALHLLALSRCSKLDVWKYLMKENPSNIMTRDKHNNLPLGYLLLHYCEPAVLEAYFVAQYESDPFQSTLEYIVRHSPRAKLRSILILSVNPWVKSFGHDQWKQAVMDAVDTLCRDPPSWGGLQSMLRKYQMKEMSSLLEFGVWNSKIVSTTSSTTVEEKKSKEFRQNCRLQCGDEVIIRNVLPFLEESSLSNNDEQSDASEDELMGDGQNGRFPRAPSFNPFYFDYY